MAELISRQALMEALGIKKECDDCENKRGFYCSKESEFVTACEAITEAPTVKQPEQKWIHFTPGIFEGEKMPAVGKPVLVTYRTNEGEDKVTVSYWLGVCYGRMIPDFFGINIEEATVTAWMPLPVPYREEDDDE